MNSAGVRWRPLLATAVVVLAAHLWLLRAGPGPLQLADPLAGRALITRTIAAAPATSPLATQPPPAIAAPPQQVRAAAPRKTPSIEPAPPLPAVPPAAPANAAREASTHAAAFTIPGSMRLRYKVSAHSRNQLWQGDGELHWRHDGEQYEARLEVSSFLLPTRTQRSTGRITADGLAPSRFSDKSRGEQAAHFERDQGKVVFSGNQPEVPLLPGAQDRLSVLMQLGALIAGNPTKFRADATIAIQTASTRDAEQWIFTVEGEEQLQLPGGTLATLKLTRAPRREFDQKVELWLAPGMDYVPVRLRLTQPNGDWLDQQWWSTDKS